jgi:hypothetical protein
MRAALTAHRSLDTGGPRSPRAAPPLLALAGARVDAALAPLVGGRALARAAAAATRARDAAAAQPTVAALVRAARMGLAWLRAALPSVSHGEEERVRDDARGAELKGEALRAAAKGDGTAAGRPDAGLAGALSAVAWLQLHAHRLLQRGQGVRGAAAAAAQRAASAVRGGDAAASLAGLATAENVALVAGVAALAVVALVRRWRRRRRTP